MIGGLLADDPQLEADVAFGIESTNFLEDRLGAQVLHAWRGNRSALRTPLNSVLPTP